jgi:hypothetical protein
LRAAAAGLVTVALLAAVAPAATAHADSCADLRSGAPLPMAGACADVLAQESRWLTAITGGDVGTVEQILAREFTHINADGEFFDRAAEIAATAPLPFTMNPSEQQVDLDDDTAVIHGVNTIIGDGEVLARERFTDVFIWQDGAWKAVSAQETAI